jgi:predicted phage tail component-like protein
MYAFKDITDHTVESTQKLSEALSIDGKYVEDNVEGYRTLSVSGRESLEYDATADDRPVGIDGMEYYGKRQKSRTLKIKFELQASSADIFMARYRALKNFCKGPDRLLRFADEPNAHYTGTLLTIDEPDEGSINVVSEMSFYCPDPYLVSDITETVSAALNADGKLVATINNDSSGNIYPVYKIVHSKENGYIGIVHAGGAFEMGNREEADKTAYARSETLVPTFEAYTGTNPQNTALPLNGSLTQGSDGWYALNNVGSGAGWHGGCYRAKLPADSSGVIGAKNFYMWWESKFMTGLMGQTGFQQVLLSDENDAFIGGFGIIKPDNVGNTANVIFWVPGYNEYKNIAFTPSVYDENAFNGRGAEDILKEGSRLRFYYYGGYHSIDVPAIADKKVTYIYLIIGALGTLTNLITVNRIGRISVVKNNVEKWKDVPNRYPAGSIVTVDTGTDAITVNGLPRNDELITGSNFYALPPGKTDVEFYTSSWCTEKPTVTVEYKKRWL